MSYNGYANYETWNVALWLDNDPGTSRDVMQLAHDAVGATWAADDADAAHKSAVRTLADQLRDYVYELPEVTAVTETASMPSDLLVTALEHVEWRELAEHYLADVDG